MGRAVADRRTYARRLGDPKLTDQAGDAANRVVWYPDTIKRAA